MKILAAACLATLALWPTARAELGVNLDLMTDWSPAWTFVDGFKHARTWIPQYANGLENWNTGKSLDLHSDGNLRSLAPGQAAAALMFWDLDGHYPGGDYTCVFEGTGDLEFRGAATVKTSSSGTYNVGVDPQKGGVILRILRTDPADPIRNLRFFMPGFEDGEAIFHPAFLKILKPFKVIRFMNWQRTNSQPSGEWSERTKPGSLTQRSPQGVSLEYMVALANTLEADPWFCMPHMANDDYIRNFAQLTRKLLNPSRKIYVEYSNEVWNGIFPQAKYARDCGQRLGLSSNPYEGQLRFYAQRSSDIFKIWEEVFGGPERLVRVLASQSENPWTARTVLEWQDAYRGADALAVAPYFGGRLGGSPESLNMSVAQILNVCREDIIARHTKTRENAALAKGSGLKLIAYEAGQHLVGLRELQAPLAQVFMEANEHAGMRELYEFDQKEWRKAGGELMVTYKLTGTYGSSGSFGLLRWQDQTMETAPKYLGFIESPPF